VNERLVRFLACARISKPSRIIGSILARTSQGSGCNGCEVATVGCQKQCDKTAVIIRSINVPITDATPRFMTDRTWEVEIGSVERSL
jgi:hypothetical protein